MKQKLSCHATYVFSCYLILRYLCCLHFSHQSVMSNKGSPDKRRPRRCAVTLPLPRPCGTCGPAPGWGSIPAVRGAPRPQRHHPPEAITLAPTRASPAEALWWEEGMAWARLAWEGSRPCCSCAHRRGGCRLFPPDAGAEDWRFVTYRPLGSASVPGAGRARSPPPAGWQPWGGSSCRCPWRAGSKWGPHPFPWVQ